MWRNGGIKFVAGETGETSRKPTQTSFRAPRTPNGVTDTRTRDPGGGRRAPNRLHHRTAFWLTKCTAFYMVLAGCPCFATVNLYLLRKVKALNFSLLLHYYVNSSQLLNYVHIDICPRRRLHRMCAFKKGRNSLSHERYSFKYTSSDKTNGL